nr:RraA family protein [uncultured Hyphomonas sp.]
MMSDRPLLERLSNLETAAAADVMVAMGLEAQVLAPSLQPLGGARMAGFALCAEGREGTDEPGLPTFDLDALVSPGAIVVIATAECGKGAIIGDNMVTSMVQAGARGFLLDGGIRDREALASGPVPVWCRYASPINAHRKWKYTAMGQPVTLPGIWGDVEIRPGDLILGDADGVVVLPREHAEQIVHDAEIHMRAEADIKTAIEAGEGRESATKSSRRLQHVRPLTAHAEIPEE